MSTESRALNGLKQRLFDLAFRSDLATSRFTLALAALFIGGGLLLPAESFPSAQELLQHPDHSRLVYAYMAVMAPEWMWGLAFFVQGCIAMYSLARNRQTTVFMWCDAVFGTFLWTTAVVSCYMAYWPGWANFLEYAPPAILGGEIALMCSSWWILVRYSIQNNNNKPCKK